MKPITVDQSGLPDEYLTMGANILVVEDGKTNQTIIEATLSAAGYRVDLADDGIAAIRKLMLDDRSRSTPAFDAVLLDLMMPVVDGFEVLKHIREKWNSVQLPVIIQTAKDATADVVRALEAGANDFVTKPINGEIMLARLKAHLAMKSSHEALKNAQNALINAARMESHALLAAGMAHEIRNPLSQIQMASSAIESLLGNLDEPSREMGAEIVDSIGKAITRADEIVRQIMQIAEDEQLHLGKHNLNSEVDSVLGLFVSDIESGKISLELDLDEDIPDVYISPPEFNQALAAVIDNAIQSMVKSKSLLRRLTIRTYTTTIRDLPSHDGNRSGKRLRNGEKAVALDVRDTGPGMTQAQRESAFDAFFTTKATGTGTGLGLTVARKIIELHHGYVRLETPDDAVTGVQVTFYLKMAP